MALLIAAVLQIVPDGREHKTISQCLGFILGMLSDPVTGYAQEVDAVSEIQLEFLISAEFGIVIQRSVTECAQRGEACGLFGHRTALA